jgi:chromosome segregation ATPase
MPRTTKISRTIDPALADEPVSLCVPSCSSCRKTKEECEKTIQQLESKHRQITDILSSQYKKDSLKLKEAVDEHKRYGEEIYNNQKTLNESIEKENTSLKEKNHTLNAEITRLQSELEKLRVDNLKNTLRSLPKFKRGKDVKDERK